MEALINARGRLTGLRGLFLGDIPYEDCEISWINQTDLTPLFAAFPRLEHFRSRGGEGLAGSSIHGCRGTRSGAGGEGPALMFQ